MSVSVVESDGRVRASLDDDKTWIARATALLVPLRELLDRTGAELGCGVPTSTLIQGDDATMALADVDGTATVVVMGRTDAPGGALLSDARWLAEQIRGGAAT